MRELSVVRSTMQEMSKFKKIKNFVKALIASMLS
jgi:hypothetical protein